MHTRRVSALDLTHSLHQLESAVAAAEGRGKAEAWGFEGLVSVLPGSFLLGFPPGAAWPALLLAGREVTCCLSHAEQRPAVAGVFL